MASVWLTALQRTTLLLALLASFSTPGAGQQDQIVFGVHPYLPASELVERFSPLVAYLESHLAKPVVFRIGVTYRDHVDAIINGDVDIAFLGPALFVKVEDSIGGLVVAGRLSFSGAAEFRGAIVTRSDSEIRQLSDLEGSRFALGDPESTLSTRVPLAMLADSGISLTDLASFKHYGNHHNVALSVLMGQSDAGGVKEEVFREYEQRGLRAVAFTPWISSHLFVLGDSLAKVEQQLVSTMLQKLHEHPDGGRILQAIKDGSTSIVPAQSSDYDALRKLLEHSPETMRP